MFASHTSDEAQRIVRLSALGYRLRSEFSGVSYPQSCNGLMLHSMKAIQVQQAGGPEVLELTSLPRPSPGAGQVLIKVEAVGLNFADILYVAGEYLVRTRYPMIPGMEFAGLVEELGEGVEGLQRGQRVAALGGSGAFAEYAVAYARSVLAVPPQMSAAEAAAFPVSYLTAYFALQTQAQARPGQWVLIQAAAGALGTASIQIARAMGLRVVALASSEEKLALCRRLGADVTLLYTQDNLVEAVRNAADGKGVDILMEVVGGAGFAHSLGMLAYRGRLLVIGSASREMAQIYPVSLMKGNQSVTGVWLTPFLNDADQMQAATAFLMPLVASGKIRPVVGERFRLEEAARAFAFVQSRKNTGKVILEP
jgi:NADPH2:quinone reductase